jgi:hypothetical protein
LRRRCKLHLKMRLGGGNKAISCHGAADNGNTNRK